MIYFIACPEANAVKIGITRDLPFCVYKRLTTTQTHCPLRLELLGVQDGYREEERVLLDRFAPYRIQGEWFRFTDELREYCSTLEQIERPARRPRAEKLVRQWADVA